MKGVDYEEAYWGSEDDIELGNTIYLNVCNLVGFDTNEDDTWGSYTIKATSIEIIKYTIEQLTMRFANELPEGERLFVMVDSSGFINKEWPLIASGKIEGLIFTDKDLQVTNTWTQLEQDQIVHLNVFDSFEQFKLTRLV